MSAPAETPGMTLEVAIERVVEAACEAWDVQRLGGGAEMILEATRVTVGRAQIAAGIARKATTPMTTSPRQRSTTK